MRSRKLKALAAVGVAAMLGATTLVLAPSAPAAPNVITIWADATHAPTISALLPTGYRGTPVIVVTKDMNAIRDELATVPAASAPDVIWADATWTSQLAAAGSIVAVPLGKKATASFRANALGGFQVGATGYGIPVQVSNVAMISNVVLVPTPPTTFGALSATALQLVSSGKAKVPFAVAQGGDSDGYSMYPLFSGLGGYFFGRNAEGVLDPTQIGLANSTFIQNSVAIDSWNASGLISAALTTGKARRSFVKGNAPFWIAGPEDMSTLLKLSFGYRISAVPPIIAGLKTAPLLRLQGFMMTKHAATNGVQDQASKLIRLFFAAPAAQLSLASASGLIPANRTAVSQVTVKQLQAIDLAGVDGIAIPNIPQMASVWAPYGSAWTTSTAGTAARLAKPSFRLAQRTVESALGILS